MDQQIPQARKKLYSWKYYNNNFNPESVVFKKSQPPPPYRNAFQQNYFKTDKTRYAISRNKKNLIRGTKTCSEKFMEGLEKYCDMSSIHGLKFVGDNKLSKADRIFWLAACLGAVIMSIYFISNLYINYDENPVTIGFNPTLMNVHEIPFPAITMCNVNIAMKSRVSRINASGTLQEKFILADLCDTKVASNRQYNEPISWETVQNVIYNVTQLCSEMLLACRWEGQLRPCDELINPVITDDGYCCTFNRMPLNQSLREDQERRPLHYPDDMIDWTPQTGYPADASESVFPYRSYGRGVAHGLTLVLDANIEEYSCTSSSYIGFKIIFATPLDSPKIAGLGFSVPPGVETRIPLSVKVEDADESVRGINFNKRQCLYPEERYLHFYRRYSARNCLLECEANYTLKMCGCVTFDMPKDASANICSKNDENCVDQARFSIERFGTEKSQCGCLPGCYEVIYQPDFINMGKLDAAYDIIDSEYLGNKTQDYFEKNVAILHFFYTDDKIQKQTKNALYGFSEFLSNTGGLLGLFMGFSFISFMEIIYFFFMKSLCQWGNMKLNKRKRHLSFIK